MPTKAHQRARQCPGSELPGATLTGLHVTQTAGLLAALGAQHCLSMTVTAHCPVVLRVRASGADALFALAGGALEGSVAVFALLRRSRVVVLTLLRPFP